MKQFLGEKLAIIELDFLRQVSMSNNVLFMLFKWLIEMETLFYQKIDSQLILLNEQQLFHKAYGEECIDIYANSLPIKPHAKKQLLIAFQDRSCRNKEEEGRMIFTTSLLRFLKENNIYYRVITECNGIVTDCNGASFANGLMVEKVIEISI